jgi:RNA polymerase sigma-70 factor (ECF subfamily)
MGFIDTMTAPASLKHLFQQEFAKMVAVISKLYGLEHIETAEDIVSETFLLAAETWGMKGIPPNPEAWLYTVAKQKTLQQFRRQKIFTEKIKPSLVHGSTHHETITDVDFSENTIRDSQLQMLFAVCNPAIASEAQIGLALRILCGFGIDEIAEAFLSNKETINKRLFRAKEKLREIQLQLELPPAQELPGRLQNVLHVIYLLFNEGYYSRTQNRILQKELCYEALRLGLMLTDQECTNQPRTQALLALMCFHASRFDARETDGDAPILYARQDSSRWNAALIQQGMHFLAASASGDDISTYHLEARIAYWHCIQEDTPEKWQDILQLYDALLRINYSPAAALNRTYAVYKVHGAAIAVTEAEQLALHNSHFYYVLLGKLYSHTDKNKALSHYRTAYDMARTLTEKQGIQEAINALDITA